jgi:hypothetical protein
MITTGSSAKAVTDTKPMHMARTRSIDNSFTLAFMIVLLHFLGRGPAAFPLRAQSDPDTRIL